MRVSQFISFLSRDLAADLKGEGCEDPFAGNIEWFFEGGFLDVLGGFCLKRLYVDLEVFLG